MSYNLNTTDLKSDYDDLKRVCVRVWDEDDREFVAAYEELEGYMDMDAGYTLVHEYNMEEEAEQYVINAQGLSRSDWVWDYLDWDEIERDIKREYTCLEYQGETYYVYLH